MSRFRLNFSETLIIIGVTTYALGYIFINFGQNLAFYNDVQSTLDYYSDKTISYIISPTPTQMQYGDRTGSSAQTAYPTIPPKKIVITTVPHANPDTDPWGVAKKVGEYTYTIKVGHDDRMGTPQEVLDALNNYRNTNGRGSLVYDERLANYSQGRADHFAEIDSTDAHAGFNNFLDKENGFENLGFSRLGENSYYGGSLYGVHLIEWVFAKSPEHNANQLDPGWTHVGIGITDKSANLIFGANRF